MKTNIKSNTEHCPCGSGLSFKGCCQPCLKYACDAPTAEALMRSRYTAFVLLNENYLRYSWHPDTCPKTIHLNASTQWLGLKIKHTFAGKKNDETGEVEFITRNKTTGKASRLHEISRFSRFQQRWVYLDGKFTE